MLKVYHEGGIDATMKLRDLSFLLYFLFFLLASIGAASRWYPQKEPRIFANQTSQKIPSIQPILGGTMCSVHELFSPHDNLERVLLSLIESETEKIQLAAFKLTSKDVANALLAAHERGVKVEIIADAGGLDTRTNQIIKLHCNGISVYIYPDPDIVEGHYSLMHNKFLICHHSKIAQGMVLWTGSFNFTKSADSYNRENALVIRGDPVLKSYIKEFEKIKGESARLQKSGKQLCHTK